MVRVSNHLRPFAPAPRVAAILAVLASCYAVLAVLVAHGTFTRFDQFLIDHLMIRFKPSPQGSEGYSGLYKPFGAHTPTSARILDVLTYPCSALISLLVVAGFALAVRRRVGWIVAVAPAAAWVVGNVVEKIGKHWLYRPHLTMTSGGVPIHVIGYDNSFPSGHMMRCLIVGLCVVLLWRRATPWVIAWAALVGHALVVEDSHTVTDVIGGALVGAMLVLLLRAPLVSLLSGSGTDTTDRSYPSPWGRTETAPRIRT